VLRVGIRPRKKSKLGILSSPIVFLSNFGVKSWFITFQNFNSLSSKMTKQGTGHDKTGCKTGSGPRKKKVERISVEQGLFTICVKF
jgi:hypothetical protein